MSGKEWLGLEFFGQDWFGQPEGGAPPAAPAGRSSRSLQHVLSMRSEERELTPAQAMDELEELMLLL